VSSLGSYSIELKRALKREIHELEQLIATGSCKDFSEYQRKVGIVDGLSLAERLMVDVERKILDTQEED